MMRITTLWLSVAILALAAVGCGSECGDLQDVCDLCDDADAQAACEKVVDDDEDDACTDELEKFQEMCGTAEE